MADTTRLVSGMAVVVQLVILPACGKPKPFLPEPGRNTPCLSSASCIESTLKMVTEDLRASGVPCLAEIGVDAIETDGPVHELSFRMGTVRPSGKLGPVEFDPPTACEFNLSVIEDARHEKTPTHPLYFTTKSGRLVRVYWYMYARDEASIRLVYRLVAKRVETLGKVLEDVQ